jgi:hypothetical protein
MNRSRIAGVAASLTLLLAPAAAGATGISMGTWYTFCFGGPGTFASGTGACSVGPNASPVGAPPWTITLAAPAIFHISDLYLSGDSFTVFDFGAPVFSSPPTPPGPGCGADVLACYGDPGMSWGSFVIGPGAHAFDIFIDASPHGGGAAAFMVGAHPGVVPEPGSVVLLATGILGIGMVVRRRNSGRN